jgi:hypothetical protein
MLEATHGFEWWDEGKDKWGWWSNSSHPGATLTLQLSTMPDTGALQPGNASAPHAPQEVMLAIGWLRSGTKPMGRARVSCVSGCTCKSDVFRGFWDRKASLTYTNALWVTSHEQCRVKFEVSRLSLEYTRRM